MTRARATAFLLLLLGCSLAVSAQGNAHHGYLGVNYNPDQTGVAGCTVVQLATNGAAAHAGLAVGDVITALDGVAVANCKDLGTRMDQTKPGQNLAVQYQRNGQSFTLQVVLTAALPPGPQDVPTSAITLIEDPRMVRLTVGHSHVASNCFGFLDISADTVEFISLTQPEHSFKVARSAVQDVKASCENCQGAAWAHFHTTQNYNFVLLDPRYVNGQATWKWHFGKTGLENVENAKFITNYLLNFDATWNADWAEIQARLHPKPPEPTTPPTPTVARVLVVTDPGGAQVYVDDVFKGESSDKGELRVEGPPGAHNVRVRLAGYKEWTGSVPFDGSAENKQHVVLLKSGPEPLSEAEIEEGLTNGVTPARIADRVKELGVNFTLNDDIEKKLRDAGADSDLLLAIAKNKR